MPHIHINSGQPRIQNEAVEEEQLYTVYPNPIQDNEFYIESSEEVDVVVMDLSGRVIYHNVLLVNSVKVHLDDYVGKVFIVKFTNEEGDVTIKKIVRL